MPTQRIGAWLNASCGLLGIGSGQRSVGDAKANECYRITPELETNGLIIMLLTLHTTA